MATYKPAEKDLVRKEGNTFEVTFVFSTTIDLSLFNEIVFQIKNGDKLLVEKLLSDCSIVRNGQALTISFLKNDTLGKAGQHKWELEVQNDTPEFYTLCFGKFVITSKLIS